MNTVFIILLFLVPGLLIKACQNYISVLNNEHNAHKTVYEQMFEVVSHSVIVTTISVLVIDLIDLGQSGGLIILKISDLLERLNIISFMVLYIIISVVITFIWSFLYSKWITGWLHKIRNKSLLQKYGVVSKSKDNINVWEAIFFNPEITMKHMIVSIYKDSTYITSGVIESYNDTRGLRRELEIRCSYEIEKVLEMDKRKPDEEKWLYYVDYEYFDLETGILIKFYDPERVIEHWEEI